MDAGCPSTIQPWETREKINSCHPSNQQLVSLLFESKLLFKMWFCVLHFLLTSNVCREVTSGKKPTSSSTNVHFLSCSPSGEFTEGRNSFLRVHLTPNTLEGCSKLHENREIISWRLAPSGLTDPSVSLGTPYKPLRSAVPQNYPRLLCQWKSQSKQFSSLTTPTPNVWPDDVHRIAKAEPKEPEQASKICKSLKEET